MTFKTTLILGLVVSLPSAVLPAARGADGSAQAAASASSSTTTITDLSTWKRSDRAVSADIRFKKPDGIVFTDQPGEPKQKTANGSTISKPAATPIAAAAPGQSPAALPAATELPSPASIGLTPITPIIIPPVTRTLAPAGASPAATTLASTAPAATSKSSPQNATQQETAETAASATPSANSPNITPYTDDQIQLVARLLIDQGVIRAAQEEPLPTSPNNAAANGQSNSARNGNHQFINPVGPESNPVGPESGEGCYDDCNCCPPQPCLFWVGGVEATFLVPDLNNEPSTFAVEEIAKDRVDYFSTESTDLDSMYVSPRIWLGVQGCCWGANLRYWHLQASEATYDPSIGGIGTWDDFDCGRPDFGFFSCNRLEAHTIDLEITRRFCLHDCWMQAAFGVRHADLENSESVTGLALADEGLLNGFARSNRASRGTGIMMGLYGRKPIFPCSCVHWFYNARWSALWGPTQTAVETFAAVQSNDPDFVASAASVNGAYTTVDDTMFIGEIQLGLEWDYALVCLPANAFFRLAIEYQRWDGGQGSSAANSFAGISIDDGLPATSIVSTSAGAQEPQMDLLGFTIGTGLTW